MWPESACSRVTETGGEVEPDQHVPADERRAGQRSRRRALTTARRRRRRRSRRRRAGGARPGGWSMRSRDLSHAKWRRVPMKSRSARIIARCIRTPCSTSPPSCCTGAQLRAAGRPRRLRLLPRASRPRHARAPRAGRRPCTRVLRQRLLFQHLAQSRQRRDRAPAGDPGLAGQRRLPARARSSEPSSEWLDAGRSVDRAALPEQAAPQPARLVGRAAAARARRRVLAAGRRASNAPAPLDLRVNALQGQARRGAGGAGGARHRRGADAVFAAGPARRRASRRCRSSRSSRAATSRCRTRAASCWRC